MSSSKLVDSGATGTMSDLSKQMRQQRKKFEASMENDEDPAGGGYHLTNIANVNPGLINHGLLIRGVLLQ